MLPLSEYGLDQVRLSDFDIHKTKYMVRTVDEERAAFKERDIREGLLLAGWVRVQGTGTMFATFATAGPVAVGCGLLLPVMLIVCGTVMAPMLLSKKKYRKAAKKELIEVAEMGAFSAISVVTSPIRHVIIPEKCYKRMPKANHPFID